MTSRTIVIVGFLVLGSVAAGLVAAGRLGLLARPRDVLDGLLARRKTRLLVVLAWVWLGWHFLVRTG
jgi:hypothetical protein